MIRTSQQQRHGTVLVFFVVCLTMLFAVLAVVVEGGVLFDRRRHAQATADASAMAAATDLFKNYTKSYGVDSNGTAKAAAIGIAKENGYSSLNATVTVNIPPTSGDHIGVDGYAEVTIEYTQPALFSQIFGNNATKVYARAVARGRWLKQNNGIIVLDPHAKGALNAHGNGKVNVIGADVIVNSDNVEAGVGTGGASLVSPTFLINGGVNSYAPFTGEVRTGVPPTPDPLRTLPPPNPNTLTVRSTSRFQKSGGTHYLLPGVYQGGIKIGGQASVVLAPGIYYMDGGGFEFKGQGYLSGSEIMIYNNPQSSNDRLYLAGLGSVTITPPKTGIYKGIAFYQNRNADVTGNVEGNGLFNISGTFYAAGSLMNVNGNGDVSIGAQYISRMLDIGGNGDVNITWERSLIAPTRQIHLVE